MFCMVCITGDFFLMQSNTLQLNLIRKQPTRVPKGLVSCVPWFMTVWFHFVCCIFNCSLPIPKFQPMCHALFVTDPVDSYPFLHLLCGVILPLQKSFPAVYRTLCFTLCCTLFSYYVSPLNFPALAFEFLIFWSPLSLSSGLWLQMKQPDRYQQHSPTAVCRNHWQHPLNPLYFYYPERCSSWPKPWGVAGSKLLPQPGVSIPWHEARERC